jgi:hypothetical protein
MTGIPEDTLEIWSKPGAQASATDTYASVKHALTDGTPSLGQKSYNSDVFLQGSYANSTNIYGNSDVDVVAKLDSTFQFDAPTSRESRKVDRAYPDATHSWRQFRTEIIHILEEHYGSPYVEPKDKAVKIETPEANAPPLDADVVVCQDFKKFHYFNSRSDHEKTNGIMFWTQKSGRIVVNYPKTHRRNGKSKNQMTNEEYKKTVRMFKNARDRVVENGEMNKAVAPSFFIECLLFNIPDQCFSDSYRNRFATILNYLYESDISGFDTQSEVLPLFSDENKDVWNLGEARRYVNELILMWNNWEAY